MLCRTVGGYVFTLGLFLLKENQMINLYNMTEEEIAELYKVLIEDFEESNNEISR